MNIRDWSLKEIAQGKPWGHPTHAMFVHFPTALFPVALLLGVLSHLRPSADTARVATLVLGLGLLGSVPAVATGSLDWLGMVRGSTKRNIASKHMLAQLTAQLLAAAAFAIHLLSVGSPPSVAALVMLAGATAVMFGGNWLGGVLVYDVAP